MVDVVGLGERRGNDGKDAPKRGITRHTLCTIRYGNIKVRTAANGDETDEVLTPGLSARSLSPMLRREGRPDPSPTSETLPSLVLLDAETDAVLTV